MSAFELTTLSNGMFKFSIVDNGPRVDIVAVHGLNPKNKEHHAERTWELDGKLWLRDFLPQQLPQARILLFGYNSSVSIRSSSAGVREQAHNLLNRLWLERQGCKDRPIIFIAHSLGGILIKEALVQAKLGNTCGSIRTATYGIAFFGTPHRGSHLAKMGETVAKAVRAFLRTPNNTFINALKEDDLYANELSANFQQLLEDYKYINFYETLPLRSLGIIVEKKSATFGLPDSREMTVALAGDHESICRYRSDEDVNYIHMSALISKFAAIAMKESDESSLFGYSDGGSTLVAEAYEPRLCMIPFSRNPGFVDRAPILDQLRDRTLPIGKTSRLALFGLGGVGKSQIAIEFAHQVWSESGISVFWVSASSIDRFRGGYNAIFDEYISPDSDETGDKLSCVKDWFEKDHDDWVIIVDNADETSLFEVTKQGKQKGDDTSILEFLPETQKGTILITTRNKAAGVKFTKGMADALIEVKPMSSEESKLLIKNNVTDHVLEESEMGRLSELLGNLPLAIVQATAFMQENSMSVGEYIELYNDSEETKMDLLCEAFETLGRDTGVPNAVATTLIVSIDQIKERDPKAAEILSLIAFLDRNDVPKSLIQHRIKRPLELTKALGTLKAFSLIAATDKKGNFSFHRLVQLVLRKWLILEEQYEQKSIQAMELVDELYPDATPEKWGICGEYLTHALSVLSLIPEVQGEVRIKRMHLEEGVALYFGTQGRNHEAERLELRLIEEKKVEFGPEHPETLETIGALAATYYEQGRWKEAEELGLFMFEANKKLLGPRARLTLTTMANLASTIEALGRMEDAENLMFEALAIAKSEFGEDDEQTIDNMVNLGSLYMDIGRADEAAPMIEHALSWRRRRFGLEHKWTLNSAGALADCYVVQGKLEEAEGLALQILKATETALGLQHPDTQRSKVALANIYRNQGRLDEAEARLLEVVMGEQHGEPGYDQLVWKSRLARVYLENNKEEEADSLNNEMLKGCIRALGPDHSVTLRCLSCIAVSQKRQMKDLEAIQLMAQVTNKAENALGAYHDDTLDYLGILTDWCGDQPAFDMLYEIEERENASTTNWDDWTII
ncbi:hypothetical protein BJX99DRAFT_254916 [Aspergillus californicus]